MLGEAPLFTILSQDRTQLMNRIKGEANKSLAGFGVELVDVRIKRADLPPENSQAVFRRMQTEREREAKELRAQGAEVGQRIRARADRERRVLIAEAAARVRDPARPGRRRGDPHLRRGLRPEPGVLRLLPLAAGLSRGAGRRLDQTFVLSPDSEFFRFFNGRPVAPAGASRRVRARISPPATPPAHGRGGRALSRAAIGGEPIRWRTSARRWRSSS